jgi:nitrous oxide reductase accessory protein NosL
MTRPRLTAILGAALLAGLSGCGSATPRVALHDPCATCSMEIADLRFGCARLAGGRWRTYDSIECLIRDAGTPPVTAWLADYDTRTLRPADSLWVVKGEFPSPMGGGFAAFANRASADSVASLTRGRVDRFAAWLSESRP